MYRADDLRFFDRVRFFGSFQKVRMTADQTSLRIARHPYVSTVGTQDLHNGRIRSRTNAFIVAAFITIPMSHLIPTRLTNRGTIHYRRLAAQRLALDGGYEKWYLLPVLV